MPKVTYRGATYSCRDDETLLDAFLRLGVEVSFSCRNGTCHVCKHRSVRGPIPEGAQQGLQERERNQGALLLCRCVPVGDMEIAPFEKSVAADGTRSSSVPAAPVLPDPEMWEALENGRKLRAILEQFYAIIYEDKRLAPFFGEVTKERSIEKQYLFLRQLFTGEKVYFGDRPRNAHHWMVISDELFDYREALMASCLRQAGLPEYLVERWLVVEESFRPDIVKSKPYSRIMGGVELPLDGFGEETLDVGALCDGCEAELPPGSNVSYHLRLGKIYCSNCRSESV